MAIINQLTRNESTQDPTFNALMQLTPEERQQLKQQIIQQKQNVLKSKMGAGLETASNLFLQMGGLTPPQKKTTDINDYIQREYIKQQLKPQEQTISVIDPATGEVKTTTAPTGRVVTGRDTLENRLGEEQDLRQSRYQFDRLDNFGGELDKKGIEKANTTLGFNIEPELEAGRGIPSIDKEGNRKYRVLSQDEWKKKVSEGKFDTSEIEHLQKIQTERRAWNDVEEGLQELGINANTAGKLEFDVVNSPIGPLSIPARFNLTGQYMQDPKYTALKRKIERAFQAFRQRVTGAQASDRELNMLRPLIASLKDRPEVFFETIKSLKDEANTVGKDRLDIYSRVGRDISQFKGFFDDMNNDSNPEQNTNTQIPTVTPNNKNDEYQQYLRMING